MINIAADNEIFLSDWEEDLKLISRKPAAADIPFKGDCADAITEGDASDLAITARLADITGAKLEATIERVSNGNKYSIYEIDKQGTLIFIRAKLINRDYQGSM